MKRGVHNRQELKGFRRGLRRNGTLAEAILWKHLKARQLGGRKFRRQHSVENYIVDFYCYEEKLVIELDGADHFEVGGQNYDEHRDKQLSSHGLKVLRFENVMIIENIEIVLEEITRHFKILPQSDFK